MGENQRSADDGREVIDEATELLSDDEFYRVLTSRCRRRLLVLLFDGDERTSGELATVLAGWNATEEGEKMAMPTDRDRILIALRHVHLPKLDTVGLIDYDSERERVAPVPVPSFVRELVSRSVATDPEASV